MDVHVGIGKNKFVYNVLTVMYLILIEYAYMFLIIVVNIIMQEIAYLAISVTN